MASFHDLGGLTYFSNKLHTYIVNKFKKTDDTVTALTEKVDDNKVEIDGKIKINTDNITKNTSDISTANDNIADVDTKVDANYVELKANVNAADFRPTGDSISLNNVEQFVFKDVVAGQVVTIPNIGDGSDFLIECFVQTEQGTPLQHNVININKSTANLLEYDPRYVEITDSGAAPKTSVSLPLTKQNEVDGYNIYVTDYIPVELLDNITSLNSYSLVLDETP